MLRIRMASGVGVGVSNITGLPASVRDLVSAALNGKSFVASENVELESALDYGGLAVLADAWERFGMNHLLEEVTSVRKRGLIKAMVFARLLFPCSKLALREQAEGTLLAQACGLEADEDFDEDDLYEAMDTFTGRWVETEQMLHREAFPEKVDLVLYDLTSTYFDGKGPANIAQYGHSRDHRGDRTNLIEVEYQCRRYVIAGGVWRQQRDRERREVRMAKADAALEELAGRCRNKVDGWYLLRTNLKEEKCPSASVLGHYKSLLGVEDAFRELKTYLEVRLIYHHRPDRVVNHVRICFIAYWLSARLAWEWAQLRLTFRNQ